MIRLDVKQGSEAWLAARLGRPTASRFGEIITPKTMELSKSADKYMAELVAEWALGCQLEPEETGFMERGSEMEGAARAYYELMREHDVEVVGFVVRDDRLVGCSPDGLVAPDGGLEMKVPSAKVHMRYLLGEAATEYMPQIQGCMWLTGARWWDFLSYHPTLPKVLLRVARDQSYIDKLAAAVETFCQRLERAKQQARELGVIPIVNPFTPDELLPNEGRSLVGVSGQDKVPVGQNATDLE